MAKRHHNSRNKSVEHSYVISRSHYDNNEAFMDSMERGSRKEAKRKRDAARNRFDDYEQNKWADDDLDQDLNFNHFDDGYD